MIQVIDQTKTDLELQYLSGGIQIKQQCYCKTYLSIKWSQEVDNGGRKKWGILTTDVLYLS